MPATFLLLFISIITSFTTCLGKAWNQGIKSQDVFKFNNDENNKKVDNNEFIYSVHYGEKKDSDKALDELMVEL